MALVLVGFGTVVSVPIHCLVRPPEPHALALVLEVEYLEGALGSDDVLVVDVQLLAEP